MTVMTFDRVMTITGKFLRDCYDFCPCHDGILLRLTESFRLTVMPFVCVTMEFRKLLINSVSRRLTKSFCVPVMTFANITMTYGKFSRHCYDFCPCHDDLRKVST